jgi:hypothetical protein
LGVHFAGVAAIINPQTYYLGRDAGCQEFDFAELIVDTGISDILEGSTLNNFDGLVI